MGDLVKIAAFGAVAALILGAAAGHTLHPELVGSDRTGGPQLFADAVAGDRAEAAYDPGVTLAAYPGKVPDYVLGTDWKRSLIQADAPPAIVRADYEPQAAARTADDPRLSERDDTTVAERAPDNPAREPAYDAPAEPPESPGRI